MFDWIIRGASICDGRGRPRYDGDIAIADGRIAALGKIDGSARREIDAKGLVERLIAPWIQAKDLVWKPAQIQAFTPRASAIAHTRAGEVVAVAGLVSGAERERRGLGSPVFAGEIVVGALPLEGAAFEFTLPGDVRQA